MPNSRVSNKVKMSDFQSPYNLHILLKYDLFIYSFINLFIYSLFINLRLIVHTEFLNAYKLYLFVKIQSQFFCIHFKIRQSMPNSKESPNKVEMSDFQSPYNLHIFF